MSTRGEPMGRTLRLALAVTLAGVAVIGGMLGLAWLMLGA